MLPLPSPAEAADALAEIQQSQAQLARIADCPPQRHLAFALVMGGFVSLPAFPNQIALAMEAVLLGAVALIALWDRRRNGVFINGYRRGRTRPLTFVLLGMMLTLLAVSFWLARGNGIYWGPLALAAIAVPVAYAFSAQWKSVFRREMGVGS
ncbi:MAG: hypothetical protein WC816_11075 [Sphingomonas sp.]|jgi:hypothetical protein